MSDSGLRKPSWLKISHRRGDASTQLKKDLQRLGLHTVCTEASCPNLAECWQQRTATVMILGDMCTRGCRFCHVKTGNPKGRVNLGEIPGTSELIGKLNLNYVVLTSVDRDDLPDHGSSHFAQVIQRIHRDHPQVQVEALVPDFGGVPSRMDTLGASNPLVIAQNLETVKRLTHPVRDLRASYEMTLECLRYYKSRFPQIKTKTSLMLGLGETQEEVLEAMEDLRRVNCDILTLGQYLQPTAKHLPVQRFYSPEEFRELKRLAYGKGFGFVAAGPLVRSSYRAGDFLTIGTEKKLDGIENID